MSENCKFQGNSSQFQWGNGVPFHVRERICGVPSWWLIWGPSFQPPEWNTLDRLILSHVNMAKLCSSYPAETNFLDTSTVARHITSANQRWVCWKNSPSVDHVPIETSIFREFPASHVWLRKDYFPIKTCPSPCFTPSEDQWARNSAHSDFSFTTSQLTSTNSRHLRDW